MWDIASGKPLKTIRGHTATVKSLCFGPQASNASIPVLASAGDFQVILSDPRPSHKASLLSLRAHEPGKEVEAVSVSSDGSLLASGGRDGKIVLTSLLNPAPTKHIAERSDNSEPLSVTEAESPVVVQQQSLSREDSHGSIVKKSNVAKKSRMRRAKRKSIDVSMAEHLDPHHQPQNEDSPLEPGALQESSLKDNSLAEIEIDNEELTEIEKQLLLENPFSPLSIDGGTNDSNQFSFIDSSSVTHSAEDETVQKQYKKLKSKPRIRW